MASFTDIFIIYNPISTGPGHENAEDFAQQLREELPPVVNIEVRATTHAGHGKILAYEYAKVTPHCLIISSSGDGGYHDIINGVLESGSKTAVTGLLPSGNANDHYHAVHSGNTIKRIAAHDTDTIDVLSINATSGKKKLHQYAHSYAGIGLTPHVGKELTKTKLNPFTEAWLTLVNLPSTRTVRVEINGKVARYKSLVFSNIHRMSKVLTLSDDASVTDGRFEVNGVRGSSFFSLLLHLLRASTIGLEENLQVDKFSFTCRQNLLIQMDGEVVRLDADSTCTITCEQRRLVCII